MKNAPNDNQTIAIEYIDGPLLIVAGAGTGKTTTLVEKAHHIVESGRAKPHEILALTFTEKAASEMEQRVDEKLPFGYTQTLISTFHSYADSILRAEAINLGITPTYRLMTEAETISYLKQRLFLMNLKHYRPLGNPGKFLEALIQFTSRLRDEDVAPEQYRAWVSTLSPSEEHDEDEINHLVELAGMYEQYQQKKAEDGVMDYGDLIYYLMVLLRSKPHILNRIRSELKYVFVDEFQDTNIAQYELIKLLCPPGDAHGPVLTVVGDDSQAIYKFRGASVSNILTFMNDYTGAKQVTLNVNYRSNQAILDTSYRLIKHNDPDTLEAQLGISKRLIAGNGKKGTPVEYSLCARVEDEAIHVAAQIQKHAKDYSYGDIALLVRANNHADPFVKEFIHQAIPYQFHGPSALYKQESVKDLIAYLQVLANPEEATAMYRVLCMPIFKLDPRDLAYLVAFAKKTAQTLHHALEMACDLHSSARHEEYEIYRAHLPRFTEFSYQTFEQVRNLVSAHLKLIPTHTAGQILYTFLDQSGILKELAAKGQDERDVRIVTTFFDRIKSFEASHDDASVFALVDFLLMSMDMGESPTAGDLDVGRDDAVHIMTVHGSKGLEYPIVFIANTTATRFPSRNRRDTIPIPSELIKEALPSGDYHVQEERRLFYVAMTRAKDHLYLTSSQLYGDAKRTQKISPFVYEALGEQEVNAKTQKQIENRQQLSIFDFKPDEPPEPSTINHQPSTHAYAQISYSQLDTYEMCPLRYKYQYVLKIPSASNAAASFGTSIHSALQAFYTRYRENADLTLEDLLQMFKESWVPVGYASAAHEKRMQAEGREMLKNFFETQHTTHIKPIDLEKFFKVKVKDQIFVTGKIDRVDDVGDGKIRIIDYKTGKKPDEKQLAKSLQLSIYTMAAMEPSLYNKPIGQIELTFYYLQNNETITVSKNLEDITNTREELVAQVHKIQEGNYEPRVGPHCDFCPFRLICSAWQ